jgi:hypothetical protein
MGFSWNPILIYLPAIGRPYSIQPPENPRTTLSGFRLYCRNEKSLQGRVGTTKTVLRLKARGFHHPRKGHEDGTTMTAQGA